MPRTKKKITMTAGEISNEISNIDVKINALTAELKEIKMEKRKLLKDLTRVQEQENEAAKAKEMEELVTLIREKGLTVEELKELVK